jgi:hypothetical protein
LGTFASTFARVSSFVDLSEISPGNDQWIPINCPRPWQTHRAACAAHKKHGSFATLDPDQIAPVLLLNTIVASPSARILPRLHGSRDPNITITSTLGL